MDAGIGRFVGKIPITQCRFPGGSSIYLGIAAAVNEADGKVELSDDGSYRQKQDVAFFSVTTLMQRC